jgi:regulatory protein
VRPRTTRRPRPQLDSASLEQLALFYVGRYATTRARLRSYLVRKLRERGWSGTAPAGVDDLVERLAGRGYVDDAAFAEARAASLQRRGYGERRVAASLRAAGVADVDAEPARDQIRAAALETARHFAKRKRLGPFSAAPDDPVLRRKAFAAMARAGHSPDVIRTVLDLTAGEIGDPDTI